MIERVKEKCPYCNEDVFKIIKNGIVVYMNYNIIELDKKWRGFRKHNCIKEESNLEEEFKDFV